MGFNQYYVLGLNKSEVEEIFSTIPEGERPKVWEADHDQMLKLNASSVPVIFIPTEEVPEDAKAEKLEVEGKTGEQIMEEIAPKEERMDTQDEIDKEEVQEGVDPPKVEAPAPYTYGGAGLKVGKVI